MTATHTLSRIVATAGTGLRFIWSDGYEETHAPNWTGFTRGTIAGHGPDGEWQRTDGTEPFNDVDEVLAVFLANGGEVEPYVPHSSTETPPDLAPYQFKAMLALSGQQPALEAFIASLPEPDQTVARSKLENSLVYKYANDLVQDARAAIQLPEPEFRALWLQAASIL